MYKIMTVLGTRPEIIRLSLIITALDQFTNQIVVHTGQNFDYTLGEIFFQEMKLRQPDYRLQSKSVTPIQEIGLILTGCEQVIIKERPDRVLILGDTNSALSAIVAKRYGIPVLHMEAGNRCYDDRVPEEVNRRIIDHASDILMPYTERSRANLLREGIAGNRIFVTGNPIGEVLEHYKSSIDNSRIIETLDLHKGKYFLITLHRAENVDIEERLGNFIEALQVLNQDYKIPVICSVHPRTRSQLEKRNIILEDKGVTALNPLGWFDFIYLEKHAACVLSDSGTVQEECCILRVPNVTLRDVTERPETIESGSNVISGSEPENIVKAVKMVLNLPQDWQAPPEYSIQNVHRTVLKIVLGNNF